MPRPEPISATRTLPFTYRLILTTLEPLAALAGAFMALIEPARYLSTLASPRPSFDPQTSFLYTELCGAWLYFAFIEAVVLRKIDDLAVWKLLCWGMVLSDICYCHSIAQAVGGWAEWVKVGNWRAEDWVVLASTAPQLLVRILVVLEVGYKKVDKEDEGKRE